LGRVVESCGENPSVCFGCRCGMDKYVENGIGEGGSSESELDEDYNPGT